MCAIQGNLGKKMRMLKKEVTERFSVFSLISLQDAAIKILLTEDLLEKVSLTSFYSQKWQIGELSSIQTMNLCAVNASSSSIPIKPSRKDSNSCKGITEDQEQQSNVSNQKKKNAITVLIHGIAHAESYAIELFWDCIARYCDENLPREFYDDMVAIANQEANHFLSWYERLIELDCPYGSLWSHDGLWKSAEETHHRSPLSSPLPSPLPPLLTRPTVFSTGLLS
jgi:uncharacterized ferritin-like protein (DUF455 family)